jgi:hypothetical protein
MSNETSTEGISARRGLIRMGATQVRPAGAAALVGLATLANFIVWLGWKRADFVVYQSWQVVGVVVGLGVIAALSGWRRHPHVAVFMATVVMTVVVSLQGGPTSHADGLWLIGSASIGFGTYLMVLLVAVAADELARRRSPTQTPRNWLDWSGRWLVTTFCLMFVVFFVLTEVLVPLWD